MASQPAIGISTLDKAEPLAVAAAVDSKWLRDTSPKIPNHDVRIENRLPTLKRD